MNKTLKDVARELNMSISTISRVVNNKDNVNEKTRDIVMAYLEKHKYTPNRVAKSLKENTTKTIGIIIPDICEVLFGQIIKGIDQIVSQYDYSIILVDSHEDKHKEERCLELLYEQRIDALVLATVNSNGSKVLELINSGLAVVFIDNLPNLSVPYDAVLIDNTAASKMAINHLLGQGHTQIACIVGSTSETTGGDRLLGYRLALEEAGISVNENLIRVGNYKEDTGYSCMEELIRNRGGQPFTAVYVAAEMMTFGAIKAIGSHGMSIPEDISVVGFDVHDRAGLMLPSITTMRQDEQQIGKLVGELLMKRLSEREQAQGSPKQKILMMPFLEVKSSTK